MKVYLATFEVRVMESTITKQKLVQADSEDEAVKKAHQYVNEMNEESDWIIYFFTCLEEIGDLKDLLEKTITIH